MNSIRGGERRRRFARTFIEPAKLRNDEQGPNTANAYVGRALYRDAIENRSKVDLAEWPPIANAIQALSGEFPDGLIRPAQRLRNLIAYTVDDIHTVLQLFVAARASETTSIDDAWWLQALDGKLDRATAELKQECERFGEVANRRLRELPMLFISHAHKDSDLAARLVDVLQLAFAMPQTEIRCTSLAGHKLRGGMSVSEQIREGVLEAAAVLGIITPNSVESSYVLFELGAAWGAEVRTFPLLAHGSSPEDLPGPLAERHPMALDEHGEVEQLLTELEDILPIERAPANVSAKVEALLKTSSAQIASS